MSIKILPPEIQNQIAAGEVVERPASVVKECIENSIDAGATHIEIRIDEGGKKLIQITDNGSGMSPDDAEKSILRHATSKIASIDDLFSIQSYGFRGEALAAISSVSDFELITKRDSDQQGVKITCNLASSPARELASANTGTTITIQNLFSPTPARLQYLKTNETEYRQCLKVIQSFALSNPEISFRLIKDGTTTLDLPSSTQKDRVLQILKKDSSELLTLNQGDRGGVYGFASAPGHYAANRNHQYLFVNGRHIEDHKLSFAVREAYVQSCGIEKHLYPVFVLFIQIDPILVDVNVHPRKTEVKFAEPGEMFSLVKNTIISALRSNSPLNVRGDAEGRGDMSNTHAFSSPRGGRVGVKTSAHSSTSTFNASLFSSAKSFAEKHATRTDTINRVSTDMPNTTYNIPSESTLTALTQIQNKYILAQSDDGLYLFDQHALHERIRFERLRKQYESKNVEVQSLLIPEQIPLSPENFSILSEHADLLTELYIEAEFTEPNIIIKSVPTLLTDKDLKQILEDTIQFIEDENLGENNYEKFLRKKLEYQSCRGSVFFGDEMKPEEMQQLLDEFQATDWNILCPHGRPNHVSWSFEEIDKMFHR